MCLMSLRRLLRCSAGVAVPALLASAALAVLRLRLASVASLVWCFRRRLGLVFAAWPPHMHRVRPCFSSLGGCVAPLVWAHPPLSPQCVRVRRLHCVERFLASSKVGRWRSLSCWRGVRFLFWRLLYGFVHVILPICSSMSLGGSLGHHGVARPAQRDASAMVAPLSLADAVSACASLLSALAASFACRRVRGVSHMTALCTGCLFGVASVAWWSFCWRLSGFVPASACLVSSLLLGRILGIYGVARLSRRHASAMEAGHRPVCILSPRFSLRRHAGVVAPSGFASVRVPRVWSRLALVASLVWHVLWFLGFAFAYWPLRGRRAHLGPFCGWRLCCPVSLDSSCLFAVVRLCVASPSCRVSPRLG